MQIVSPVCPAKAFDVSVVRGGVDVVLGTLKVEEKLVLIIWEGEEKKEEEDKLLM